MGKILSLAVILAVAGAAFLFFGKDKQKAEAPAAPEAKSESGVKAPAAASLLETEEIVVKANSWYFEPAEIRVKEGMKVKIILQGVSGTHALAIADLGVKSEEVGPGETTTVEFTADKKGEFSFRCAVFCGEGHKGMTGKLVVE